MPRSHIMLKVGWMIDETGFPHNKYREAWDVKRRLLRQFRVPSFIFSGMTLLKQETRNMKLLTHRPSDYHAENVIDNVPAALLSSSHGGK